MAWGIGSGRLIMELARQSSLHIVDGALAPMSGGTSQPNLNAIVEDLRFTDRSTGVSSEALDELARYWDVVRQYYKPFETVMLPATADLYSHEMPGGQYTNLYQQAKALGMADRWTEICMAYAEVNLLFGDAVPTYDEPSSLRSQVEAALADPIGARARAWRGRRAVLERHTFEHRAGELLDALARHGLGPRGTGDAR